MNLNKDGHDTLLEDCRLYLVVFSPCLESFASLCPLLVKLTLEKKNI